MQGIDGDTNTAGYSYGYRQLRIFSHPRAWLAGNGLAQAFRGLMCTLVVCVGEHNGKLFSAIAADKIFQA